MLKLTRTLARARISPVFSQPITLLSVRFNSTQKPQTLTSQIYPINKDSIQEEDLDEWLNALQKLKKNTDSAETETEIYLQQLTKPSTFLSNDFVPTEQQKLELEQALKYPIPSYTNPLVESLVNFLMRSGRKSQTQKIVSRALYMVSLKTRKDPVEVLSETIEKLGPLFSTRTEKTGTAKNRVVPFPLNQKQRNRFAIKWIVEGSDKKKSKDLAVRLAEEIVSAYEGKSAGFDKRSMMHKQALAQRAFIKL